MEPQRGFFADKLMDLANSAMAALIFGQVLEGRYHAIPVFIGVILFCICSLTSYILTRERDR